jgi:acetyl esterase
MPLDPKLQILFEQMKTFNLPNIETLSAPEARQYYVINTREGAPEPVASVEDRRIPGPGGDIPIRIYKPQGEGPFPALVFFHGGGWVLGSIDSHDPVCRSLTNLTPCTVISVEYRLAPEHKFPAAVEDAYAATKWIAEHAADLDIDPERLAVGGDSAGGNLSAVITHLAKEQGGPDLSYQVLIYPATDSDTVSASKETLGADDFILNETWMRWFDNHYLNSEEDHRHPQASPMFYEDFTGLPPALVITAEMDPLRDEGEAYAEKLKAAGVPVVCTRYDGMVHGFFSMDNVLEQAQAAHREVASALRTAFTRIV